MYLEPIIHAVGKGTTWYNIMCDSDRLALFLHVCHHVCGERTFIRPRTGLVLPPSSQAVCATWSNDRLLVPLVSYSKCQGYRVDKALVIPVEDSTPAYEMDGVLAMASKGGDMCNRFESFCRENLCMESWYFIVDVVLYEMVSSPYLFCSQR